jgi:hypothetical protein
VCGKQLIATFRSKEVCMQVFWGISHMHVDFFAVFKSCDELFAAQ